MTALITVSNSDGCVGRCDAKCYNATKPKCDCVCGGKNHGAGLEKAKQNTLEYAEDQIQRINAEKSKKPIRVKKIQEQLRFF